MIPLKKVKEIFKLYGFSVGREKPGVYVAFEAGLSMYSAVEIFVIEENEKELDKVRDYYTSVNFSVVICRASKIEEVELHLFNRFFQVKASNQRIAKRYKEYTESILESYAITDFKRSKPYEYINAPYTKEVNMKLVKTQTSNVVDSIQEDLKDKNPRLIIVEAAAGFGKTSTAMELMNKYANVEKDIRPFMMVLYNDRKVNTFRYLLLSQIESDFNAQLKNNLVIHNIRQGYIPLIIDGFDELLCQDIDKGSTSIDKDRAESMLSVLSGLLTDKAKIVLTTRRTAIFSESSLTEWYERDLKDKATVSVYQLQSPTISDWLPFERVSKLSDEFISIAHPVLLGYLKYLSDAAFDNAAKQSSLMTDYFIRLMEREIVRQSLPFKTIEEQNKILTNLASCFVLCNYSAPPA